MSSSPWLELVDLERLRPYYFNVLTRQTVWDRPIDNPPQFRRLFDAQTGRYYFVHIQTQTVSWDAPMLDATTVTPGAIDPSYEAQEPMPAPLPLQSILFEDDMAQDDENYYVDSSPPHRHHHPEQEGETNEAWEESEREDMTTSETPATLAVPVRSLLFSERESAKNSLEMRPQALDVGLMDNMETPEDTLEQRIKRTKMLRSQSASATSWAERKEANESTMAQRILKSASKEQQQMYDKAVSYIRDATSGRKVKTVEENVKGLRLHLLYYNQYFRAFFFLTVLADCVLTALSLDRNYVGGCPAGNVLNQATPWSFRLALLGCLLVYVFDTVLKLCVKGPKLFFKGKWNVITLVTISILIAEWVVVAVINNSVLFGAVLRPVLFVTHSTTLRHHMRSSLQTFFKIVHLAAIMLLFLTVYSIFGVQLARSSCPKTSLESADLIGTVLSVSEITENATNTELCQRLMVQLGTFPRTALALFVLLTTENYPDITYNFVRLNPYIYIYFISFILIGVFVFMSVLLAVIFNAYKDVKKVAFQKARVKERMGLMQAWDMLDTERNGYISQVEFVEIIRRLRPQDSEEERDVLFSLFDSDGDGLVDLLEFFELSDLLNLSIKNTLSFVDRYLSGWFRGFDTLRKLVEHKAFHLMIDLIILANAIVLITVSSIDPNDTSILSVRASSALDVVDDVFFFIFLTELVLRMLAYGVDFLRNKWNYFDFCLVAVGGFVFIFGILRGTGGQGSDNSIALMRLLRMPRILRLFGVLAPIKVLGRVFFAILPTSFSMLCFMFVVIYCFAVVGVMMMGCRYPATDTLQNFRTIPGAALLLFQILTGSNWHQIMYEGMDHFNRALASSYFLSFFIFGAMLVLNLVMSLIIESYTHHVKEQKNAEKEQTQTPTDEGLESPPTIETGYSENQQELMQYKVKTRRRLSVIMGMEGMDMQDLQLKELDQLKTVGSFSSDAVFESTRSRTASTLQRPRSMMHSLRSGSVVTRPPSLNPTTTPTVFNGDTPSSEGNSSLSLAPAMPAAAVCEEEDAPPPKRRGPSFISDARYSRLPSVAEMDYED